MSWHLQRPGDEMTQQALAEGAWHRALEYLVQTYQHAVVGFCTTMLGSVELGEEVAQDVFLAAYKAMPHFRQQASIRTWLFAIARKQCLKMLRNSGRRRRIEQEHQEAIAAEAHREAPVLPAEDPEVRLQLVKQSLDALDANDRALLLMRYDTGLLLAEVATIIGISETSVRRRLARALQRLREVMEHDA